MSNENKSDYKMMQLWKQNQKVSDRKSDQRGVSLIETVIYAALLAIFLAASFLFINNILSTSGSIIERNELAANKEFIDHKFAWLTSQSSGVTAPVPGGSGSSLTITGSNAAVYPAVITISNNRLMLSLAGGAAAPITNNRVKVTSFSVEQIATSNELKQIRITTSMQSAAKSNIVSSNEVFSYFLP